MAGSTLTGFNYIPENSEATPGLWNSVFSVLSQNIAEANSSTISSNISTLGMVTINADSTVTDYIHFHDPSNQRSDYLLGSFTTGTADGLNIYDVSGQTMIVSFSKQSVRFFQNIVGPVFDTGGALTNTLNAATFGTAADSVESRIQAAISAASLAGIARVYVPASMYPYSAASISFDTRVQMVREGGDWTVFDVVAYGANGNNSSGSAAANQAAIQSAISGANADPLRSGIRGGTVYVPTGSYQFSGQITVPVTINQGQVVIRGANMRASILQPITSGGTAILFGAALPDVAGTVTNQTEYCALENLELNGSGIGVNTCAVQFTEMQRGRMENVLITGFAAAGCIGVYLRGSTGNGPPHSWRGTFINLNVANTYRPLVIQNGDENDFFGCNFGLPTGLASVCTAVELLQGNSNRFFGTTLSGENSSLTTGRINYTGFWIPSANTGQTSNNQIYGMWSEGFDSAYSIGSGVSQNAFYNVLASFSRVNISDTGQNTIYTETGNNAVPFYQFPDGVANSPSYAFRSENSLGWYRSGASAMALAPEGRLVVGSGAAFSLTTQPEYGFGGEPQMGMLRSAASAIDFYAGNVRMTRLAVQGGLGSLQAPPGSNASPSYAFVDEPKLGWYRSGSSVISLSYGTLNLGQQANFVVLPLTGSVTNPTVKWGLRQDGINSRVLGQWDSIASGLVSVTFGGNQLLMPTTSALTPSLTFLSEASLGFYRSGNSTIATSYGTFLAQGPVWASGLSVGPGGTQIPAISSISSLVGAFIVQPSASSFTGITWAAAKIGDHIITSPFQGGAASSLSSGLVAHSIVTVNGQIEFRLSNVSTLVQNQSSQTWIFTRITAF